MPNSRVDDSATLETQARSPQALQVQSNDLVPIKRVPDDVLREIFMQSLPTQVTFNCLEAPLLLSHICGHWRALALDCAQLWTSLKITPKQSDIQIALRDELVLAWLERCKVSPVDFHFIFRKATLSKQHETPHLAKLSMDNTHFKLFPKALTHVPAYNFRSLTLYPSSPSSRSVVPP
ncbi:hypothetical protein BKA70DRAFT_171766 [Coprinopsis sp. MPI-PUGE-AT-0042]|nr:hypothetical protein BKA70DRAFT_171766 [Coprinopsis sp. MPI-PUGE-AT-0042]